MPIITIFLVVVIIFYGQYANTVKVIESEYDAKIKLIEESIYNETKYTEILSKITERDISGKMEANSNILMDKYIQNPDILNWDLDKLKKQLDGMDIYILDKKTRVVASTIDKEIGLDLSALSDFSNHLKEILDGDRFVSDTLNFAVQDGELKKYSYIPTPDNRYLLELSVTITNLYPELRSLNVLYLSRNLRDKYPFVEDIKVYRFNRDEDYAHDLNTENVMDEGFGKDIIIQKDKDKIVRRAIESNEAQDIMVKDKESNEYRLKYIPYITYDSKNELSWWKSYVIEILFNDKITLDKIKHQRRLFIQSMTIISVLYFAFASLIIYLIRKKQELAYQDHLTKLPNRKRFEETLESMIVEANKKSTKLAILFFDLDKFKDINDTYGHNVGDRVLQEVANKIKSKTPKGDIVSRLGGDEFTAIISNIKQQEEIVNIGEIIMEIFKTPLQIDSEEITMKASIGISIYPDNGNTLEDLLLKADKAMYEAKEDKMGYKIYEEI